MEKTRKDDLSVLKVKRIMKIITVLLVVSVLQISANTYAQNQRITVAVEQGTFYDVVSQIENQSEYMFFYNSDEIDNEQQITIHMRNKLLPDILNEVLKSNELNYKITGKHIVIMKSKSSQQQTYRMAGLVIDENGEPVTGANIFLKGTSIGVISDMDGKFSMEVSPGSVLVITYLGYIRQEIALKGESFLAVTLQPDWQNLDEVVVIGYGTVKKSNLSGAVSSVTAKDIRKIPASNLTQALQGNVPGLYAVQNDRNPGQKMELNIRGKNSFSGGDPLFIVDGFPIASEGGLSSINANDIESISVLKDASSTAIYGARAANGVILITTKSGKTGKPVLEVDAYFGVKFFSNPVKMMNAQQFAELRKESFRMDGTDMPSNAFLTTEQAMLDSGRSTNWWDESTSQGRITQNYQLSLTSGTETTKLYFGAGYFEEQGIVNNSGFKRGNLRFNASQKFGRVTISTYNNLSLLSKNGSDVESVLFPSVVGNPMSPVVDPDGNYYAMIQNALGTPRLSPVAFTKLPVNRNLTPVINTSLAMDMKIIEGLTFKTQISGEIENYRQNFYNPKAISGVATDRVQGSDGFASVTSNVSYNWINENILTYNKVINTIHALDALAGFSVQQNIYEQLTASATGFASDVYESYNLGASSGLARKPTSNKEDWNMLSYFGRVVYTLQDKYIFTANMRVDGSSRFGKDNKYGYFPSGAAAWRISEENFMEPVEWLSDLKLRTSYGLSGNAGAINPYQTLSMLNYTNYNFDGKEASGYYESKMPSANLKWETTKQFNLGLDVSVLKNRLSVSLDYYNKKTEDLIRSISIPGVAGFPSTFANMGDLQNRGIDLAITSVNMDTKDFVWRTSFLLAHNKNKLVSLGDGSDRIGTDHWVGMPIGIGNRYMIQANGIWQKGQEAEAAKYGAVPGDVRYIDVNDDDVINDEDRVFIGSIEPNFYGSMTNELIYKNFDLNVFMTFEQGRDIYNGNNYVLMSGSGVDNNRIEMLDRWTSTNPSNKYPRASASAGNRLSTHTSEFLENASFLKIKNITLGYTLPIQTISKLGMNHLRVYFSVVNPVTITKYTGMDPEDSDIGNTQRASSYPITRNFMLGLQVKF